MSNHDVRRFPNASRPAFAKITNKKVRASEGSSESQDNGPEIIDHSPIKSSLAPLSATQTCKLCSGQDEYSKVLQTALKEVLDQNEALRLRVIELEAILSKTEDDIEEKDELIQELQTTLSKIKSSKAKKC
ncbi:unnamed protein product [Blepharisma stoltei]|uniref:Uncharacterized protein n=1 Tax=Blepharisma stoltei TaxID=1481888 RepID=A0AAU9IIT9_9CILI|nr:unnamed protein product [Blepharisma stoltei]